MFFCEDKFLFYDYTDYRPYMYINYTEPKSNTECIYFQAMINPSPRLGYLVFREDEPAIRNALGRRGLADLEHPTLET